MSLKKIFGFVATKEAFNNMKISINATNTKYMLNGVVYDGTPDVPFEQVVFIEDIKKIFTRGQSYETNVEMIYVDSSVNNITLDPNKYYKFGEVNTLTINFNSNLNSNIVNHFMFEFNSPSTSATSLSLPSTIKWCGLNTIEQGKTYVVSVINNIAILGSVTL